MMQVANSEDVSKLDISLVSTLKIMEKSENKYSSKIFDFIISILIIGKKNKIIF